MTDPSQTALPPPEPRDRPGIRPPLDLDVVRTQVRAIQDKLAAERAARAQKGKGS